MRSQDCKAFYHYHYRHQDQRHYSITVRQRAAAKANVQPINGLTSTFTSDKICLLIRRPRTKSELGFSYFKTSFVGSFPLHVIIISNIVMRALFLFCTYQMTKMIQKKLRQRQLMITYYCTQPLILLSFQTRVSPVFSIF